MTEVVSSTGQALRDVRQAPAYIHPEKDSEPAVTTSCVWGCFGGGRKGRGKRSGRHND